MKFLTVVIFIIIITFFDGCRGRSNNVENKMQAPTATIPAVTAESKPAATPARPNLQSEILDDRFKTTSSPLGTFDFKNYSYPLPHGWENPDGSDLTLTDGRLDPVSADTDLGMDPDEAAEKKSQRRIGASIVATKYFDVTGDGEDDAIVILKIETTGSAIPQIVYIFSNKQDEPELIWYFRTGDRADGGLKDLRGENGELVVELYGQDRFLLGETETGKITYDFEQICCPTFFTRTHYKWNGNIFRIQGKRLTFSVADPKAPPVENMSEIIEKQKNQKK